MWGRMWSPAEIQIQIFTLALVKHAGLFAEAGHLKITYILCELAADRTACLCGRWNSANQSFSFHIYLCVQL